MCQIRVQYHIYRQCQLADPEHGPSDEPGHEQPGVEDVSRGEPVRAQGQGQLTSQYSFISFGKPFAKRNTGHRDEPHEATQPPAETGADEESSQRYHKIKETTIFQCPVARDNDALDDPPNKRHCNIGEMGPFLGYDPNGELDHTYTPRDVPCPVCKAIEDAEDAALKPKFVVSS